MSTSTGSGLPSVRQSHSRNHSHSVSSGSLIPSHRVTRRKSVSSNASNVAAMAAVVREGGDILTGMPISTRRNTSSKSASARAAALGSLPSPPASLPTHRMTITSSRKAEREENAIEDDDDMEDDDDDEEDGFAKSRIRRSSEGQHLMNGKKANDLKCEKCGKGYKHSSCLTKHLLVPTFLSCGFTGCFLRRNDSSQMSRLLGYLLTFDADGNIRPNGHIHRNCLSLSTSKCSYWKPRLFLWL